MGIGVGMARNTHILGILSNNRVQIERWGTQAIVDIDPDSMKSLREALYTKLPKERPLSQQLKPTTVTYDKDSAQIKIQLKPYDALLLRAALCSLPSVHTQEWHNELAEAVREYERSISIEREPGIDTAVDAEFGINESFKPT
jgi:hypothetical protein